MEITIETRVVWEYLALTTSPRLNTRYTLHVDGILVGLTMVRDAGCDREWIRRCLLATSLPKKSLAEHAAPGAYYPEP